MSALPTIFAMIFASAWTRSLFRFFRHLGGLGLFLLGILDSSFLVMPLGNDVLLIAMVTTRHGNWFYYAIMASLGSAAGVLLLDLVVRKGGEGGLGRLLKPQKVAQLKRKMEKKTWVALITAALMPPPFPFTAVVITAAALQYPRKKLLLEVFLGRLVRFIAEALLAIYFGRKLLRYLRSEIIEYFVYGIIVIAIVGSIISVVTWVRSRHKAPAMRPREATD